MAVLNPEDSIRQRNHAREPWLVAFRIAAIYVVVAVVWIAASDSLLGLFVSSHDLLTRLSIVKGMFYVVATAIMLYVLVLKSVLRLHASQQSLYKSESLMRLFVEHAPVAVAMFNREMRYLIASRRWLSDYHLADRNIIGVSHYEVFPNIPERWKDIHRRCLAGESARSDEDTMIWPDGSIDWLRWEIHPWWTGEGDVGGIIMFAEIVTDEKVAKEALSRSEQRLSTILETVPGAVTVIDMDGTITYANVATERMLGVGRQELVGRTSAAPGAPWTLLTLDGEQVETREFPSYVARTTGKTVYGAQFLVQRPDLSRIAVSINAAPIRSGTGAIVGAVASLIDVTQQKRAEDEMRQREEHDRRVREEAEEAKREFYRGTIFSVTDGKLNLVRYEDIELLLDPQSVRVPIENATDLQVLRETVVRRCEHLGMTEDRIEALVTAVGEAAANAVKHAGSGSATIGEREGSVQVSVRDSGPGMDALILPKAMLLRGFSTKPSLGLGYMLILESVDTIYLATENTGTWILMEKVAKPREIDATIDMLLRRMPDVW